MFGNFAEFKIPECLRKFIFKTYGNLYGVIEEDMLKQYEQYESFQDFFTREIKPRQINYQKDYILSPADSQVLTIQDVIEDKMVQLKGFQYSISEVFTGEKESMYSPEDFQEFKLNKNNKLVSIIFYLSPGDYHRFHIPFDAEVKQSIHIPGFLKTVRIKDVLGGNKAFEKNERVILSGSYPLGNFKMAIVGAYNVGSIKLNFDDNIQTNVFKDKEIKIKNYHTKNTLKAGEELGMFKLGSSIVMLLEVPRNYTFNLKEYQKVKYGEKINF